MKYLKIFTDFALDLKPLNDAECGRLFRAMLQYAEDGIENELPGREAVLWGTAKKSIDNQKSEYDKRCKTNKIIATNRYESLRNATKGYESCQDKEKEKDKDKYKKEILSNESTKKTGPDLSMFSIAMQDSLKKWLQYKKERKEDYKPTGLNALLSRIQNKLQLHSEPEVIGLIDECMANGWQGIIWDKLQKGGTENVRRNTSQSAAGNTEETWQGRKFGVHL